MPGNDATTSAVLTVSDISFRYAEDTSPDVVSKFSLSIYPGEIICLLGASGCGKSTILNLIAGLLSPQQGQIQLKASQSFGANKGIGYIFQSDPLFPWRTVRANVMLATDLGKGLSKLEATKKIQEYLSTFHLNEQVLEQYPAQLSGGMRQRISIIQALMFEPKLFLLDEPFAALDFFTKLKLETEFHQLVKAQSKSAIVVTHDIEEAIAMGDRVLVLTKGGKVNRELKIEFDEHERTPTNARGAKRFAEYYGLIWSDLKAAVDE